VAKITIKIEDTERGGASVEWASDGPGYLHAEGTMAEQTALAVLAFLAKAGGQQLPLVPIGQGEGD
jgi:hypothetical protein